MVHFLFKVDFVGVFVLFIRSLAAGGLLLLDQDLVVWLLLLERVRCADASC